MSEIPKKYARRRFTARRDQHGVPHITADSLRTALYALGYMHAVDRPTQMLFARAIARGEAAERIADRPQLLETDRLFRKAGLYENLDREVDMLDDRIFGHLTAYCEGVNDGMKQAGRSLPMWATGFYPQPWTQKAVMLIGKLLSFGALAVEQQQNERLLVDLIQTRISDDHLRELFSPLLEGIDLELLRKVKIPRNLSNEALELITDLPRLAGSNAWALSPKRSATGSALLAADPHLEVNRLPAIWYEVVLRFNGRYVMGASLPGCPLFGVGRTEKLAWGVTYLKGDTCDFFIEHCRPGGKTQWQYRRGNQWLDFQLREEVIQRKGDEPEILHIYENPQGTLNSDPDCKNSKQGGPGYHLSFAWAGHGEGAGSSIGTWLDVIEAPSARDAMDLVKECAQPTLNWVFADREGHIGLQACGWFPKRPKGITGLLPVPAWDKHNHWQGWISSDLLPRIYDPPEGYIVSANEDVNRPGGPMLVTMPVPDYRKRRIVQRLDEIKTATIEDMQSIQYDVMSLQASDLLKVFLPHMPEGEIKERLAAWDCTFTPESLEATLFSRLYRNVLLEIFGHSEGIGWRRMLYLSSRMGYSTMVLTCIDRLLHKEESGWWQKRDKGELIRSAAERLVDEKNQPWSEINEFHFTNRFFENHRVGRALGFHTRRMAMPGCHATVFQGHLLRSATRETTFAPSYHFVTDLGSDMAWTNLPGGSSESRFSKFYKNGISLWREGRYKQLALEIDDPIDAEASQ